MNCIKRTRFYTGAVTKTSVVARFWTTILYKTHVFTIFNAIVFVILIRFFTSSTTFYKCCHANLLSCLLPHNLANQSSNRSTADRTRTNLCFTFYNCSSQTGTTCVATTTTVVSRKDTQDSLFSFIYFYCKCFARNSKEDTDEQTYTADNCGS